MAPTDLLLQNTASQPFAMVSMNTGLANQSLAGAVALAAAPHPLPTPSSAPPLQLAPAAAGPAAGDPVHAEAQQLANGAIQLQTQADNLKVRPG